jgi:malonate transporter and related proteins
VPSVLLLKLLAIFAVVGIGYVAGRAQWLRERGEGEVDVSRVLANAAFTLFIPALLFRTTARIDFATLPWSTLAAYFAPTFALLLAAYAFERRSATRRRALDASGASSDAAVPAVRAMTVGFGNTVQLGIPIAAALFGEAGLAVHLAIVSLHALLILTVTTALVELDLAHAHARGAGVSASLAATLATTVRNTLIHPVVLPVVAGIVWNLLGLALPGPLDEMLRLLAQAAVPLCLVIIGLSFAQHGLAGLRAVAAPAAALAAAKLLLLPALVLVVAHWGYGLHGMPLAVVVLCAALPIGSNALIFAQRYRTLVAETTVATALSTLAFVATAPLWLLVLGAIQA